MRVEEVMIMMKMLKDYKTINSIVGPLIFVEKTHPVGYGELVSITMSNGEKRLGQVLDTSKDLVVVQSFEGTSGMDPGILSGAGTGNSAYGGAEGDWRGGLGGTPGPTWRHADEACGRGRDHFPGALRGAPGVGFGGVGAASSRRAQPKSTSENINSPPP